MPNAVGYEYARLKLVVDLDDGTKKVVHDLHPEAFGEFNKRYNADPPVKDIDALLAGLPTE